MVNFTSSETTPGTANSLDTETHLMPESTLIYVFGEDTVRGMSGMFSVSNHMLLEHSKRAAR